MTVKELIKRLETANPEAKIIIFDTDENDYELIAVLDYKTQIHLYSESKEPEDYE